MLGPTIFIVMLGVVPLIAIRRNVMAPLITLESAQNAIKAAVDLNLE